MELEVAEPLAVRKDEVPKAARMKSLVQVKKNCLVC